MGSLDDDELSARAFEEAMRRLKVPPLDRKIFWAEMDTDNSGTVTLKEFASRMTTEPCRHVQRQTSRKWSATPNCLSLGGRRKSDCEDTEMATVQDKRSTLQSLQGM